MSYQPVSYPPPGYGTPYPPPTAPPPPGYPHHPPPPGYDGYPPPPGYGHHHHRPGGYQGYFNDGYPPPPPPPQHFPPTQVYHCDHYHRQDDGCFSFLKGWTAYDVSLTDDSWPEGAFDVIDGKTSNSWERLDVGALVSHSFELEAKVKGQFHGAPAVIKYRVPTKAALQEAFSTPIFPLDILEDRPPEAKFDWAKKLLAKYGSVVSVISIVTLFVYLVASPSSAARASKKKR